MLPLDRSSHLRINIELCWLWRQPPDCASLRELLVCTFSAKHNKIAAVTLYLVKLDTSVHVVTRSTWGLTDSGIIPRKCFSNANRESAVLLSCSLLSTRPTLERKNVLCLMCFLKTWDLNSFSGIMNDTWTLSFRY